MRMINFIKVASLFLPVFFYAQNIKIIILDKLDKKPLNGIQIFSENGSFIGNSNSKGEFEFDKSIFQQSDVKSIMVYDSNYLPVEYKIDEIPSIVYLEKIRHYELESVVIVKKLSEKYFTIKGYFRSWQLVNNKLVKYADGMIEYHIPYDTLKHNDFVTGIKSYATEYRTFKANNVKDRSKFGVYLVDGYLQHFIPKRDKISRGWKFYKLEQEKDSLYDVFEEGKNVGYVINDKNNKATEINISRSFEGEEEIKLLFWKISGKFKEIEKWTGNGEIRHPSYLFSSQKSMVKTKTKEKFNAEETINEIFIDDKVIYNDKKPEKFKIVVDRNKSFYNSEYWKEQIKKHPLPSAINNQLINVNENENNY